MVGLTPQDKATRMAMMALEPSCTGILTTCSRRAVKVDDVLSAN